MTSASPRNATTLHLVTALVVSALYATGGAAAFAATVATLAAIALATRLPAEEEALTTAPSRPVSFVESAIVFVLIVLPLFIRLHTIARGEFPFGSDNDYHLVQATKALAFWKVRAIFLFAALALLVYRGRPRPPFVASSDRKDSRFTIHAIAIVLAFAAEAWLHHPDASFAVRYPGGGYFVDALLLGLAKLLHWPTPIDALRTSSVFAVCAWLLVLRPLVVRRAPELSLLPFALYFFWQRDVVFYFTSAYLEPWSVVLVLTAMELVLRDDGERAWLAWLLIGAAAMVKEQAILVLPFAVVAGWRGGVTRARFTSNAIAACYAALPFVLYFNVRSSAGVQRRAALATSGVFTAARMHEWLDAVRASLGFSLFLVVALLVVTMIMMMSRRNGSRAAAFAAAGLFQVFFFFSDRMSLAWTGYARFHLLALALIGAVLFTVTRVRTAVVVAAGVALINIVSLPNVVSTASTESTRERSFYFPARSVGADAQRVPRFSAVRQLRVATNFHLIAKGYDLDAFPLAYPDLATRYNVKLGSSCDCSASTAPLYLYGDYNDTATNAANVCLAQMRRTCATVLTRNRSNYERAALGIP